MYYISALSSLSHIHLISLLTHLSSATAIVITFSNPSSTPTTTQICTSGGYPDICCIPLDTTSPPNQQHGWLHPTELTFSEHGSVNQFMAVYRNGPGIRPCSGEAVEQRHEDRERKSVFNRKEKGISSALVLTTLRPMFLRKRWPDTIVVGTTRYEFSMMEGESFLFRDDKGTIVRERTFGGSSGCWV